MEGISDSDEELLLALYVFEDQLFEGNIIMFYRQLMLRPMQVR